MKCNFGVATLLSAALIIAVFYTTNLTESENGFDTDGLFYAAVARPAEFDPAFSKYAPWCYRILTPFLAGLLPGPILANFQILAISSNFLSLLLLFLIMRRLGFSPYLSLLAMLLYAGVFWTLKFSFYSPAYVDYQTNLFLLCAIYCVLRQKYIAVGAILLLGTLQKESLALYSLFAIAHYFFAPHPRDRWKAAAMAIYLFFIPFVPILALRYLIAPVNDYSPYLAIKTEIEKFRYPLFYPIMLQSLLSGLGILPLIILLCPRPVIRFLGNHREWIAYGVISAATLMCGIDKSRLFLYVLPFVIILCLVSIDAFCASCAKASCRIWICITLCLHFFLGGYLNQMPTFGEYLSRWVPEHTPTTFMPYLRTNMGIVFLFLCVTAVHSGIARLKRASTAIS